MSEHYGTTPNDVRDAILAGLSALTKQAGTGCLLTLKAYAGARNDVDAIDSHLSGGLPAMLVAYHGGGLEPQGAQQQQYRHKMEFSVICVAGTMSTREERLASSAPTTAPGIEDLLDWATYYGLRAMAAVGDISRPHVTRHTLLQWQPGRYVAAVELVCERDLDIYDDALSTTLESLGLVHDPVDYDSRWLDAGVETQPNSSLPADVAGGAEFDLE